ncbi:transposase [Hymenobacter cavernae]|uniref:Transposase n=1 Tax=Hymenobacter cavernae TaxID=2044852 RepID=A0ABQ1UWF6_9BACT|nr:transposase [Hymenobacter cavernae]
MVSAPILEGTNFIQTGLQATLKALSTKANTLVNAGVVEQVLTKGFTEKNMLLAKNWYDGLMQVSNTVKQYRRVRHLFERQTAIITIYSNYIGKFKADPNLRPEQVAGIVRGYTTLIQESASYLDDLTAIVSPLKSKMTDAERMELIDALDDKVTHQYDLVSYFTRRNMAMSFRQNQAAKDLATIKQLYGLAK